MRKNLSVFFLLVVLAAPAMAARRDDDSSGRRGFMDRLVRIVRSLEEIVIGPPKP